VSQEEQLLLVGEGRLAAAFIHVLGGGLTFLTEIRNQATHRTVARIFRSARLPGGKPGLKKISVPDSVAGMFLGHLDPDPLVIGSDPDLSIQGFGSALI
jgi:hypothetical protein